MVVDTLNKLLTFQSGTSGSAGDSELIRALKTPWMEIATVVAAVFGAGIGYLVGNRTGAIAGGLIGLGLIVVPIIGSTAVSVLAQKVLLGLCVSFAVGVLAVSVLVR